MDFGVVENLVSVASNNGGSLASETGAEFAGGSSSSADVFSRLREVHPYNLSLLNSSSGYGGVRSPFTPSQWMELEHQALIYKYITANVPIPSYLLIPIKKAMESCGLPGFSLLNGGRSGFHLEFSKSEPVPGRCRRSDGKKWRCSREAVAHKNYCEHHMNRGRHRSRKPVDGQAVHFPKTTSTSALLVAAGAASKSLTLPKLNQTPPKWRAERGIADGYTEFGSVSSDSLLNPLSSRNRGYDEDESLSREFDTAQMGQGAVGAALPLEQNHRQNAPVSYGGPLGEALHTGSECKNPKWENRGGFGGEC